jgi:MFS family permease
MGCVSTTVSRMAVRRPPGRKGAPTDARVTAVLEELPRLIHEAPEWADVLMGGLIACAGLVLGILLCLHDSVSLPMYFGACGCVGLGNGLAIPSSNAGVVSVRPEMAGSASGLSAALTVGGGAFLSAITGMVLTEANAAPTLLAMMLLSSGMGLLATLYVMRLDAQEKPLERG